MKTLLVIVIGLAFGATLVNAQQPAPIEPPAWPLIPKADDFAKWTVTVTPLNVTPDTGAAQPTGPDATKVPKTTITVIKTLPVRLITTTNEKGQTGTIWAVAGFEVLQDANYPKPTLFTPNSTTFIDYTRADFPELLWISSRSYIGTKVVEGKTCWAFRAETFKSTVGKNAVVIAHEACVDAGTKLPVSFSDGFKQYLYKFDQPPTAPLVMPAEVKALIEKEQRRLQRLSLRPPPG